MGLNRWTADLRDHWDQPFRAYESWLLRVYGNGVKETRLLTKRLQVGSIDASKGASSLLTLSYGYGAGIENNGNVRTQTQQAGGHTFAQTYAYDPLNRLQSVSETTTVSGGSAWNLGFQYDQYGNMAANGGTLVLPAGMAASLAEYNPGTNRRDRSAGGVNISPSPFDKSGNLVSDPTHGVMQYDQAGRLIQTQLMGKTTLYGYDAEGRRVRRDSGALSTYYVYDGAGQLAAEYGASEAMSCTRCYLTADMLGSTRLMTDEAGNVKQRIDYLPFGDTITASPTQGGGRQVITDGGSQTTYSLSGGPTQKFTGKERDGDTGLDYFGARYLSGAQGRFTTADAPFADQSPIDPQSWNLYGYVRNNPLVFVDPTGAYLCSSSITTQQCEAFEQGRLNAQTLADGLKKKHGVNSSEYKEAQRAIDALGIKGKDNGVTVAAGSIGHRGGQVEAGNNGVRLTIDSSTLQSGGSELAVTIAHEGVHTADASDWIRSKFGDRQNPTTFDTEFRAFKVTLDLFGQVGMQPYADSKVLMTPGYPSSISDPQIEKYLAKSPAYRVTRQNPGPKFDPRARVNRK